MTKFVALPRGAGHMPASHRALELVEDPKRWTVRTRLAASGPAGEVCKDRAAFAKIRVSLANGAHACPEAIEDANKILH